VEVSPDYKGVRLAIANANIPNMVAQISEKLADANLNIISLVNKSRDEIAYTLIDIDAGIDNAVLKAIMNIKGVLQVRKLLPGNVAAHA
jgi:D-3-phosphoglycerate dehydrogenase